MNNSKAVKIIIKAHSEKRETLVKAVKSQQSVVNGLRKNAKLSKRSEAERYLGALQDNLKRTEDHIHELDSFDCVVDEYAEVNSEIERLCEIRRNLCSSRLIECEFKASLRDGVCLVH